MKNGYITRDSCYNCKHLLTLFFGGEYCNEDCSYVWKDIPLDAPDEDWEKMMEWERSHSVNKGSICDDWGKCE